MNSAPITSGGVGSLSHSAAANRRVSTLKRSRTDRVWSDAQAMRRILVDHARGRSARKRGGDAV
ncbi:MAG: hypothetical protein HGB05_04190, partial [Chloroflexi bacterium]|nr:hypothetical protein [Chloroflexota bacterium]